MKTAMPKNTPKPTPPALHRRKLIPALAFAFVLVAAATIFLLCKHHQSVQSQKAFQADKARFAQVEADMALAANNAINEGQIEKRKTCSHKSAKYSEGSLYCVIALEFKFQNKNDASTITSIEKGIEETKVFHIDTPRQYEPKVKSVNYIRDNEFSCELGHSIIDGTSSLTLKCSRGVSTPVYTLAE